VLTWPHLLSISRIAAAIPISVLILSGGPGRYLAAAILFAIVSLTDLLDGPLARRGRVVGPLGVYLDTTADKVLVSVVLIALAAGHLVDVWMVMVIVAREFLVSGIRTLAAVQGFVVQANFAGKIKTTVTLAAIVLVLLVAAGSTSHGGHVQTVPRIGMVVATILTLYSGIMYLISARSLFVPALRTSERLGQDAVAAHRESMPERSP